MWVDKGFIRKVEAMAVYVDDMWKRSAGKYRQMKMSHMIADTKEELLNMAKKIGVQTKWIQKEGTYKEHFDISLAKRKSAIKEGAKEITWKQLGKACVNRKNGGVLGLG